VGEGGFGWGGGRTEHWGGNGWYQIVDRVGGFIQKLHDDGQLGDGEDQTEPVGRWGNIGRQKGSAVPRACHPKRRVRFVCGGGSEDLENLQH